MKTVSKSRTQQMADYNGTDLNLLQFHVKEECVPENIKVEEVEEEIMMPAPEVIGWSWADQNVDVKQLLKNENRNLESSAEQLLTENPVLDTIMETISMSKTLKMADNNGTDLNFLQFHIEEKYNIENIKVEEVEEEIMKTESEVVGGSWVHKNVDVKELLDNKNRNLESSVEQLLTESPVFQSCKMEYTDYSMNSSSDNLGLQQIQYFQPKVEQVNENIFKCPACHFGYSEEQYLVTHNKVCPYKKKLVIEVNSSPGIKAFEDNSKTYERIHNLSTNCQKDNENEKMHKKVGFGTEEKVPEQDLIENMKINNKEERCNNTKDKSHKSHIKYCQVTERAYKCNECSYTAVLKHHLQSHIRTCHTMEKPYKCNECFYATGQKRNLLSHVKQHHTMERAYKCNECSYAAVQKRNLLSHIINNHTMERPYKCNECSYTAVLKHHLASHVRNRHTMEKPYQCNECSYATAQKSTLLSHIKHHHTAERAYKCNECSYAAVEKHNLLSHIKHRHTMEKAYKCHECSYTAVLKHRLVSHIRIRHTTVKPYKCNECSYATAQKRNLLSHVKQQHTMERAYKCNECSYAAVTKSHLLSHIKHRHTMEKAYKCNECSYAAAQKCDLLSHIKHRHTMERPYKCNECSYTAVLKHRLLSHIRIRHTAVKP